MEPKIDGKKKEKKRPRNTRADGLKRIRLEIEPDEAGRRKQKYFYGRSLAECEEKKRQYLNAIEAEQNRQTVLAQYGIDPSLAGMSTADWIAHWESIYGAKGGYGVQKVKSACCTKLRKAIGHIKLKDVRQYDIQRIASAHAQKSKASVRDMRQITNAIFRAALKNNAIIKNPCDDVSWEHAGAGTHRYLEDWEIKHIVASWYEHRVGIWAMLMLFAGLRRGEALALRWENIDMEGQVIHVRAGIRFEGNSAVYGPPKTEAGIRSIPMLPPLCEALKRLYGPFQSDFVCVGATGNAITESVWARSWEAYLNAMENLLNGESAWRPGRRSDKDAKARKRFAIRAHDLRHTFCSMLYDAGVDIKTAQKLMGHSSTDITMRIYTHLSDKKKLDGINKIKAFTGKFTAPILPPNIPDSPGKAPKTPKNT